MSLRVAPEERDAAVSLLPATITGREEVNEPDEAGDEAGYDGASGEIGYESGEAGYDGEPRLAGEGGEAGEGGPDTGAPASAGAAASTRRIAVVCAGPEEGPLGRGELAGGVAVPMVAVVAM